MKRPLLLVGLLFVGGILAAEYISFPPLGLLCVLAALVLLAIVLAPRTLVLYPAIFLAGAVNLSLNKAVLSPNDLRTLLADGEPKIVNVRGVLLETPVVHHSETKARTNVTTQAKLEVEALPEKGEWRGASGRIVISSSGETTNLFAGQLVEVSGVIGPPPEAVAEGVDYRADLARIGYYFQLRATEKDWQALDPRIPPPLADRLVLGPTRTESGNAGR